MKKTLFLLMIIIVAVIATPALIFASSCDGDVNGNGDGWVFPGIGTWQSTYAYVEFFIESYVGGGEISEDLLRHIKLEFKVDEDGYGYLRMDWNFNSSGHEDSDTAGYGDYYYIFSSDPGMTFFLIPYEDGTMTVNNPAVDQDFIDWLMWYFWFADVPVSFVENFAMTWDITGGELTLKGGFDFSTAGDPEKDMEFTLKFRNPQPVPDWDGLYLYPSVKNDGWWHLWLQVFPSGDWIPTGILYHFCGRSSVDPYIYGNMLMWGYSDWDFDGDVQIYEVWQVLQAYVLWDYWGDPGEIYVFDWNRYYEYDTDKTGQPDGLYFYSPVEEVLWEPWNYNGKYPVLSTADQIRAKAAIKAMIEKSGGDIEAAKINAAAANSFGIR